MYIDYLEINALYHHGIKGQRKGVRRFQNEDGTLTEEGRVRYGIWSESAKNKNKYDLAALKEDTKRQKIDIESKEKIKIGKMNTDAIIKELNTEKFVAKEERKAKIKKYATLGSVAVISALALTKISKNLSVGLSKMKGNKTYNIAGNMLSNTTRNNTSNFASNGQMSFVKNTAVQIAKNKIRR